MDAMDDFTPPPPRDTTPPHTTTIYDHVSPPPVPPPPQDLPQGYRASTDMRRPSTATDLGLDHTRSRGASRQESVRDGGLTPSGDSTTQRRGSFGFLSRNRSRSHEVSVVTTPDGHTMLRKSKLKEQEERLRTQREREAREQRPPPVIPSHGPLPTINTFGGDDNRPDSVAIISNKANNFSRPGVHSISSMPGSNSMPILSKQSPQQPTSPSMASLARGSTNGSYADPRADTANGKHYSLASTSMGGYNSPRRVRRRKDPTPFNVLVIGSKSSGKTSLIDFLKSSLSLPPEKQHMSVATPKPSVSDGTFNSHYVECEFDGERVGLTLWDSQGLEKNLVDLQIREMATFIESKFEETFTEESKVNRSPGSRDTHIHCVFLVLDPANLDNNLRESKSQSNGNAFAQARGPSGLSQDLDMLVMKGLAGKTTVIPIISKADTLTGPHMDYLKRAVWTSIQTEKLDPLDALGLEESEDESDYDSEDQSDADALPIQSTRSSVSADDNIKFGRLNSDSELSDEGFINDHSPMAKTHSSATTPSPGQPIRSAIAGGIRPGSRGASRSLTPGEGSKGTNSDDIYIPFSLLSPDPYEMNAIGRRFPWGVADPYNEQHCDYVRLRDSVFSEWRTELRSAAREKWYETWRTSRLAKGGRGGGVRQTGGVTPTSAVPREGRIGSVGARERGGGGGPVSPFVSQGKGLGIAAGGGQRPATSAGY